MGDEILFIDGLTVEEVGEKTYNLVYRINISAKY